MPSIPFVDSSAELEREHGGKRVRVYFNLHKRVWSIQHNGRVIAHCRSLWLHDVVTKISEAGRQRVIRDKRKNVHAFITGVIGRSMMNEGQYNGFVTYNPYKADHFYYANRGPSSPYVGGDAVWMVLQGKGGGVEVPRVCSYSYSYDLEAVC